MAKKIKLASESGFRGERGHFYDSRDTVLENVIEPNRFEMHAGKPFASSVFLLDLLLLRKTCLDPTEVDVRQSRSGSGCSGSNSSMLKLSKMPIEATWYRENCYWV